MTTTCKCGNPLPYPKATRCRPCRNTYHREYMRKRREAAWRPGIRRWGDRLEHRLNGLSCEVRGKGLKGNQKRFCCRNHCISVVGHKTECGELSTNWKGGPAELICPECGVHFLRPRSHAKRVRWNTCSPECDDNYRVRTGVMRKRIGRLDPMESSSRVVRKALESTKEYKGWRAAVHSKSGMTCILCGTKHTSTRSCRAHHCAQWCDYPEWRYHPRNGVTVCLRCPDGRGHLWLHSEKGDHWRLQLENEAKIACSFSNGQ